MSFKVFISYSSKDEMRISPFLRTLKSITGLNHYFFKETKEIAQSTHADILTNIKDSDAFLIFHSVNSLKSSYTQNEIRAAIGLGKQIIVVKLDKTKPAGMLKGINYLDFYDKEMFRAEMDKLISWIRSKITERQVLQPTATAGEEGFDWVNFLLLVGVMAGSLYLISKAAKKG